MAEKKILNPPVLVNNETISYIGNTLVYDEGLGEQKVRAQTAGNGETTTVFSDDETTKISMLKFAVYPTPENIERIRTWKLNGNANAATIVATGEFPGRSFNNMSLIGKYEVAFGADTTIELEFHGDPAV